MNKKGLKNLGIVSSKQRMLQLIALIVLTIICASCGLVACKTVTNEIVEPEKPKISSGVINGDTGKELMQDEDCDMPSSLIFTKELNSAVPTPAPTVNINVTIEPSFANENIGCSFSWKNPNSTFALNKDCNNYVMESGGYGRYILTLKEYFGEQILFKVFVNDNPTINAICTLDCLKNETFSQLEVMSYDDQPSAFLAETGSFATKRLDMAYSDIPSLAFVPRNTTSVGTISLAFDYTISVYTDDSIFGDTSFGGGMPNAYVGTIGTESDRKWSTSNSPNAMADLDVTKEMICKWCRLKNDFFTNSNYAQDFINFQTLTAKGLPLTIQFTYKTQHTNMKINKYKLNLNLDNLIIPVQRLSLQSTAVL
ncbi:MAG: hypothetical protein RR454_00305 [Clostridia bacterium]